MSRIDDLIREHCPNGVRFVKLGELCTFNRGQWIKADQLRPGPYPVVTSARDSNASHDVSNRTEDSVVVASSGAYAGHVSFWSRPIYLSNAFTVDAVDRHSLLPKYMFYFLASIQPVLYALASSGGVPNVYGKDIEHIRLPHPPLEVQREIVRILDTFTQLEAELEAELEARRLQYAHLRGELMRFGDNAGWVPLGDVVGNLDRARRPVTRGNRRIGPFPYYGANGIQDFVDDFIFDGTFLLIGEDGSVVRPGGLPVVNWATGKIWVNNHAHVLVEKPEGVRLRFLFHFLQTVDISSFVTGGTQPKLNQANMNRIMIPVPTASEQERIVATLDELDALVNDLSVGLPAELAARRKQYEHYRDRLLTFRELSA